jgi:hypothetical protein
MEKYFQEMADDDDEVENERRTREWVSVCSHLSQKKKLS